jgi:uncharacterized membrane protein YeaQ/YmgE (transglycosylase-associated protein family)
MSVMVPILVGGFTGWLTGKLIGDKGYGKPLVGGYVRSLDVLIGLVGASFAGYLLFSALIREASSFATYGAAILGSMILVGACRLISAKYFPSPSYRGMSRAAFIKWHDTLAVKELARWKPRRGASSTPAKNHRP